MDPAEQAARVKRLEKKIALLEAKVLVLEKGQGSAFREADAALYVANLGR